MSRPIFRNYWTEATIGYTLHLFWFRNNWWEACRTKLQSFVVRHSASRFWCLIQVQGKVLEKLKGRGRNLSEWSLARWALGFLYSCKCASYASLFENGKFIFDLRLIPFVLGHKTYHKIKQGGGLKNVRAITSG